MNPTTVHEISELLNNYNSNPADVELEIRIKDVSEDIFISAFRAAVNKYSAPVISNMINFISTEITIKGKKQPNYERSNFIQTIEVIKGKSQPPIYIKKTRIGRNVQVNDHIIYTITASKELSINKFEGEDNPLVRFKRRASFNIDSWRLDFTAVKEGNLKAMAKDLILFRNKMFPECKGSEYADNIPYDIVSAYEIEIEYIGSAVVNLEDLAIVKKLFDLINPNLESNTKYHSAIISIAKIIHSDLTNFNNPKVKLKQLANQVISLDQNEYYRNVMTNKRGLITVKADGMRAIIDMHDDIKIILSDSFETMPGSAQLRTILDVEMLEINGKTIARVFDVIMIEGKDVSSIGMEKRITYIDRAVKILEDLGINAIAAEYAELDFDNPADLKAVISELWTTPREFTIDGLIISILGAKYIDTKNYKWKPFDRNTIDFLAVSFPTKYCGMEPFIIRPGKTLYILCVGIKAQMRGQLGMGLINQYTKLFPNIDRNANYIPIQFSPSLCPLAYLYYHDSADDINHMIVELGRNELNTDWVFHRTRPDRVGTFGNDFLTAELTWNNYINKFPLNNLWERPPDYFMEDASNIHSAPNGYKRYFIRVIMEQNFSGAKFIVDEASGRGADLGRYQAIGVKNCLFIDISAAAIAELISRKYSHIRQKMGKSGGALVDSTQLITKDVNTMTIHTLVADLKTPCEQMLAMTYQFGVYERTINGIICNFALHYLCDDAANLQNLLEFNSKILKVGGIFMFTIMDGQSVFDLLKNTAHGKFWESRENDIVKYAIRKDYLGDKLANFGQYIAVKLPFAAEPISEPLCNLSAVLREAKKYGFSVEVNSFMDTEFESFAGQNGPMAAKLTAEDRAYIGLFKAVTMRKIK